MWPKAIVLTVAVLVGGAALAVWLGGGGTCHLGCTTEDTLDPAEPSLMDSEQREHIWQIEHYVLVLSKFWFQQLAEQLARGDGLALSSSLAAEFAGEVPDQPVEERLDNGFVEVVRQKSSARSPRQLGADDFKAYLLEWRGKFTAPPQARVVAKVLAPKDAGDQEGVWQGRGVARLWGEMGPGRPGEVVLHFQFEIPRPERTTGQGWLRTASVVQTCL
jgi:hypothetical protein